MSFVHLQVRSGYSIMKSSVTIDKLVHRAKELGFDSLALTDEQVLYGIVPFYQACQREGIKPIIGMTINVNRENDTTEPCILLAQNNAGYKNLLKLSSHIQLQDEPLSIKDLSIYLSNLVVILPATNHSAIGELLLNGNIEHTHSHINNWKELIEEGDLYLGVNGDADFLSKIKGYCKNLSLPVTAIGDVRYLKPGDQVAFECLQAMRRGDKWEQQVTPGYKNLHLQSGEEMEIIFKDFWYEALAESVSIAKRCNVQLNLNERMLPSFPVPNGETSDNYLRERCYDLLYQRYDSVTTNIKKRLDYELDIIKSMQFSDYFLIVWDFIRYAKEQSIMVGPGRGSAAGSLVAFVLGITTVDPMRYDLLFERFLNPERVSMPDIDIDFSDHRRDEVIQYVRNKYGPEHVAQIITFGTFATRSLLRELIKTMNINQQDASFILKEISVSSSKSIVESVKASEELTAYVKQSTRLQTLFKIAARLEGLPRHVSTHAAGVVISEKPLVEHVPLTSAQNDMYLTQFAMKELETVGLLKMDFLGLRNLSFMERICTSVEKYEKKQINLEHIPLDDRKTFALLQEGKTNGVFQLESQGMQNVLTKLIPTNFEDVVAVNALYRPGPMEYIPTFINRKHGKETISYPHEDLKPILENTYGVLVYQEQIIQIASKMAGFSLGQADILRRAVSKKQQDVMEEQEHHFINGCTERGYSKSVAREIFAWIVRFSNYGFNRSHAVAYSKIAFQLAYLKAHFPAFFMAEILSSAIGAQDKIRLYMKEARSLGIEVLPPSINKSYGKFVARKNTIRMGLLAIKGVGHQAIREIIQARKNGPFRHLFDFCLRVPLKVINRQVLESLILAGAFDETHNNRASLLATIDQAMEQGELFREFDDQQSFFQGDLELDASYIETEPFTVVKQLSLEKELIGLFMSNHPLSEHREQLRKNGYLTLTDLIKHIGKNNVRSSAIIQEIKVIRTKRGDPMAFVTFSDENGEMEAVLFPELYRNVNRWIREEMLVFFKGKVEERSGRTQILVSELRGFDEGELINEEQQRLFVKITEDKEKEALTKIKQIAEKYPGTTPVIVYQEQKKATYQLSSEYYVHINQACLKAFYNTFGKEQVAVQQSEGK